jgi:hypothetical protein
MKLSDHESDSMAGARLEQPPNSSATAARQRESWLDKLARHLGTVPVDHMMIPPSSLARERPCDAGEKCPA